ncbi:MAG: 4Fe-4S dicluster domain-containing protein [Chloroflexi bacterium]|nr:4Fe-4S dicluster domain-containing protein [Chloroflexota bacterium]
MMKIPEAIVPDESARSKVESLSGERIAACYQCEKCTNGCPVTFAMDIVPHKLMRLVHYGALDPVLRSRTVWACASCETCSTRCPNGIDITHVMDTLRQLSLREGSNAQKSTPLFHREFLSSVRRHGRVHEAGMIIGYTLKNEGIPGLLRQAGVGLKLLLRGKLKPLPRSHAAGQVKEIFKQAEGEV